jgi:hypothetical protein
MINSKKSSLWYVMLPGEAIANSIRFEKEVTVKQAKEYMRRWLMKEKLPKGTQFWC